MKRVFKLQFETLRRGQLVRSLFVVTLFVSLFLPSQRAWPDQYPSLENQNTEIIPLPSAQVDLALRLSSIEGAGHSIQSVTYLQGVDAEVGAPLVRAFRGAMNKGVQGEFIYDRLLSRMFDPFNQARKALTHPNSTVISLNPSDKAAAQLKSSNIFHEKILIIDSGTPNEKIFIGGRNNQKSFSTWLDFAFLVRPIDPSKPYLGTQIKDAYSKVSADAKQIKEAGPKRPLTPISVFHLKTKPSDPAEGLSASEKAEFERLNGILRRPASIHDEENHAGVFVPRETHLVTKDLISNLLKDPKAPTPQSHVILDIASQIPSAKKVSLFTMNTKFAPELLTAIHAALENGAEIQIYTGPRTIRGLSLQRLTYYGNMAELRKLIEFSKTTRGKVDVLCLKKSDEAIMLHRKLVLIEKSDGTKVSISGTDNLNVEGARRSNEIMLSATDDKMADYLNEIVAQESPLHFERIDSELIENDHHKRGAVDCLVSYFRKFY